MRPLIDPICGIVLGISGLATDGNWGVVGTVGIDGSRWKRRGVGGDGGGSCGFAAT
jgi:hypothetical protein